MPDRNPTPAPTDRELSKIEINDLPIWKYQGPVRLVSDDSGLESAIKNLLHGRETVVGFDIECRPAFQKGESHPPAVVQLASSAEATIIQLRFLSSLLPLAELFGNAAIVKAGVGIDDDLRKLKEILSFMPAGFVELGKMANGAGLKATGVRTLAASLLGIRISKGSARVSNWARSQLSPAQVTYAATDAWICREIYLQLRSRL